MFDELTGKLELIFKNLKGQGKLTEKNIKTALRDVRRALLEADVNFRVAKKFLSEIEKKALGEKVLNSITPGQQIVKIVHTELVSLLGGEATSLHLVGKPSVVMVCGLQGSGKTTSVAKLAAYLKKAGKIPVVASIDIHRPAAIEQLKIVATENDVAFFDAGSEKRPAEIARHAKEYVRQKSADVLIMDTAGRLHIDESMMEELAGVRDILAPDHVVFVADGMTGQDAVNAATGFFERIPYDGIILTKVDGDARGGAALSIRAVTGRPILFVGTGERIDAFDMFYPERFASRILGMGDVVTLVEKAQQVVDEEKAKQLQEKIQREGLTLTDFLEQLQQLKKMGPLDQIIGMIPGVGKAMKGLQAQDDSHMKQIEAIILSMTKREREKPSIIDGSRRKRIAQGSGTTLQDVNNLLKQFQAMQKMMKKFSGMRSPMGMMKNMQIPI